MIHGVERSPSCRHHYLNLSHQVVPTSPHVDHMKPGGNEQLATLAQHQDHDSNEHVTTWVLHNRHTTHAPSRLRLSESIRVVTHALGDQHVLNLAAASLVSVWCDRRCQRLPTIFLHDACFGGQPTLAWRGRLHAPWHTSDSWDTNVFGDMQLAREYELHSNTSPEAQRKRASHSMALAYAVPTTPTFGHTCVIVEIRTQRMAWMETYFQRVRWRETTGVPVEVSCWHDESPLTWFDTSFSTREECLMGV